ncbi:MAG TPA: response regulator transcription factor [bacterium]
MRILIADDHSLYRAGVRQLLAQGLPGAEVLESTDSASTRAAVGAHPELDLVLLDLAMPGEGGLALLRALATEAPAVPVAILSASENPADAQGALKAGASGFIPKSASDGVILAAVQLILKGGVYVPPLVMHAPAPTPDAALEKLTPRQRDVLRLLGEGKANKEIGAALGLSEATVKQHVSAILKALNASNRVQAVLLAKQVGGAKG